MNHAFWKSCFVGILGVNQNEEREEKEIKYSYQTIRKTRREKIESSRDHFELTVRMKF